MIQKRITMWWLIFLCLISRKFDYSHSSNFNFILGNFKFVQENLMKFHKLNSIAHEIVKMKKIFAWNHEYKNEFSVKPRIWNENTMKSWIWNPNFCKSDILIKYKRIKCILAVRVSSYSQGDGFLTAIIYHAIQFGHRRVCFCTLHIWTSKGKYGLLLGKSTGFVRPASPPRTVICTK